MIVALRFSLAAALLALLCLALPSESYAAQINIGMGPNYYTAANVTIQVGDTIVWTNSDGISHSATSDNGFFDSGSMQPGATYSRTFTDAGTFPYHCTFHTGMSGVITVAPAATLSQQPAVYGTQALPQSQSSGQLRAQAEALLAKVRQLQAQLGASGGVAAPTVTIDSSSCPNIGRSLKKGSSGEDVTRLQQFLARDAAVYPEGKVTGYYGTLTEAAVKRWQAKYNVVSSGTAESTGYGVVGPRTAAAIAILCSTGSYNGIPGASGSGAPVGGFIQVTPVTGNAPLSVAAQVTVNTVTSCTGATYTLDWGDNTQPALVVSPAGQCTQLTQTLGHTYAYGGTYRITLSSGGHHTSATVQAYGGGPPLGPAPSPAPTPSPTPPSGGSWGIVSVTPAVGGDPLAVSIEIDYPACAAYSIDWGDGSLPHSVAAQGSCSGSSAQAVANHTYSVGGSYTISLRDGSGAQKADSAVSIVN